MDRNHNAQDGGVMIAQSPVKFNTKTVISALGHDQAAVRRPPRRLRSGLLTDFPDKSLGEILSRQVPVTLPDTATVQAACCVMRNERVGAIMVTGTAGRLVGLFTGRDGAYRVIAEALDPATTPLYSVMTLEPDALPPEQRASDALRMMNEGGYRHLPVVDGTRLVGIVTREDLIVQHSLRSGKG
jgi:CBS domain-containing protein